MGRRLTFQYRVRSAPLAPYERVTKHFEYAGIGLAPGTREGVYGITNANVVETAVLHHLLPACTRHATSNSSGPKVDVRDSGLWYRFTVRNVGKLQMPSGS